MCNRPYVTQDVLDKHMLECGLGENKIQITKNPSEDYFKFKNWEMTHYNHYCM